MISKKNEQADNVEPAENYSDGGEKNLIKICSAPDFSEVSSWRAYADDWAIYYHLSPIRKNLFNWIEWSDKPIKVLELGAGCGAVTSYFASLPNVSRVVAVEGSTSRAEIIKARCKAFKNVDVHTSNIDVFKTDEKFDLVLLIGVLEYAGKYVKANDPFLEVLGRAHSFIAKNGTVVLAIENQLGHKYLAGKEEDHYGVPYEGVSNYPNCNGIRTFDKSTLKKMLNKVGLESQRWYYPYPDYKTPNIILSDICFTNNSFDWLSLLEFPTMGCAADGARPVFNEKQFMKIVSLNADPTVFMNSFLVFAGENESMSPAEDMLAVKMNSMRQKSYGTIKYFKEKKENGVNVISKTDGRTAEVRPYCAEYKNLGIDIVDALYFGNTQRALRLLDAWSHLLSSRVIASDGSQFKELSKKFVSKESLYESSDQWLASSDLDLIPVNVLYQDNMTDLKLIDLEWDFFGAPVPLELVKDRGIRDIVTRLERLGPSKAMPDMLHLSDAGSYNRFEEWFQMRISGLSTIRTGGARKKNIVKMLLKKIGKFGYAKKIARIIMDQA